MSKKPTWSKIKAKLSPLEKKELLNVIRDLYRLNTDNQLFLTSRLGMDVPETLIEPYRKVIRRELNPARGLPGLELKAARHALDSFKKANDDPVAVIELMVFYVEQGVACTCTYGDIDAQFYQNVESVFVEAVKAIRNLNNQQIAEKFKPRLEQAVIDTSGIGWGFHDFLTDYFDNEYPFLDFDD